MEEEPIKIDENKEEMNQNKKNSENYENKDMQENKKDDVQLERDTDNDEEVEDSTDNQIKDLNEKLSNLKENVDSKKFARVDSKPEFASEIINIGNNQKVANLEDDEIGELLDKRKFVNLLNNFGWNRLANRILMNIRDVENYSLSEKGMLIKNVMTEQAKTAQYTYEQNKSKSGRDKKWSK